VLEQFIYMGLQFCP